MAAAKPAWGRRVAGTSVRRWLVLLWPLAGLPAQEPGLAPEFQLFLNAQSEISRACVYHPSDRAIVAGALRTLADRLGAQFARHFPATLPEDPTEALAVYAATIRELSEDPAARAQGWTTKQLVERSLDSYCQSLDAYCSYTDEETSRRLEQARQPDYVGVGVTLRLTARGYFCYPFRGGAADRAGLQRGDELLELNGVNARSLKLLELSEQLGGKPGSTIVMRVKHPDGVSENLVARREPVLSTPLAIEQTGSAFRISFVRINERAFEDLRQTLLSLGPGRPLILDFRGCGGGELSYAIRMAELFLPEKTVIARLESVRDKESSVSANLAPYRPARLILLQDESTASGAELIIAALLGYAPLKAESRGEKTFGKGVTERVIRVARGGLLKITDARIFGPHDEFWDGEGLPPSSDRPAESP